MASEPDYRPALRTEVDLGRLWYVEGTVNAVTPCTGPREGQLDIILERRSGGKSTYIFPQAVENLEGRVGLYVIPDLPNHVVAIERLDEPGCVYVGNIHRKLVEKLRQQLN